MIYISSVCSQKRFDDLVAKGLINCQFQNQKFHGLMLKGLSQTSTYPIDVISFYPVNRLGKRIRKYEEETEYGVKYSYPLYLNYPIIHHISKFCGTFRQINKLYKKGDIIVCNIMNFDECQAALLFRRFHKVKVCAITADVPGITSGAGKKKGALWKRILVRLAEPFYHSANSRYDGYLFLTEAMNTVVNTNSKPYVVVEGIADSKMSTIDNTIAKKNHNKTILYAGGLHREYGIQLLVDAFRKIMDSSVELHIYGKGNYETSILEAAKSDSRIKYYGTRSNNEIVAEQIKAHILVNPRPSKEDFVKYSFPSKIMECMASGTPLLTTLLPCIPSDYYPYIYTIEDETVDGVYHALQDLLSRPVEELHEKGHAAKTFILTQKNPVIQGGKLKDLLDIVQSS